MTDFGHQDPFVGVMKAVIWSRAPRARVVDLCHGIPPGDARAGALALRSSVPYFPAKTLFVCVVDPGVGSRRRVLWARTKRHSFLAPDNGLLSWLPDPVLERRAVTDASLFLEPLSGTFHGRDLFAPVAAALLNRRPPSSLGPRVDAAVEIAWPENEILAFDRFGNAVTSIPSKTAGGRVVYKRRDLGPLRTHYAAVPSGKPLAVAGSSHLVELSVRDGDFRTRFRASIGDPVHVR
ncbi:MAG: SAM-dependent chlorinase/fluorinase [Elusimicrobiota bacterium]|nr:SAM-dependent chlorinase/fluorinase [Elusimicrobiota bacterium]